MILLSAIFESFRSLKDKTYKLTFETSELTPEQLQKFGLHLMQFGFLAFQEKPQEQEFIDALKESKVDFDDTGKTKGQRLRAVLYRNWEIENKGYEVFDDYYNFMMERIITHYKQKLP